MNKLSSLGIFGILVALFIGYITTFLSGIVFSRYLSPGIDTGSITPTPTMMIKEPDKPTSLFTSGKHYYDDTIMLVEKESPHRSLIATVTRTEQDKTYVQNTRVSFYDGKTWTRKVESMQTASGSIIPSTHITSWVTTIDESRVLKEKTEGSGIINEFVFRFATGDLQNEISMRSLPGYTKFMSEGEGKLVINDVPFSAYVLYTRIYSANSAHIQFYNTPLGITTDWIAFWDTAGNFFHIDSTHVTNPVPLYSTHQIGVQKTSIGSLSKTFMVDISRSTDIPPTEYAIRLLSPLNTRLNFRKISNLNKMPNNSYDWFIGHVEGTATIEGKTTDGIGIAEYIKD